MIDLKKLINVLIYVKWIVYYIFACAVGIFAKHLPAYKDLWLVSERKTDARDNGYHLFCYLCKNTDVNCAYVIKKSSPDYKKVCALGRTIEPQTFSHMLAFACAKVKISTHYMGYAPDTYRFCVINKFFPIFKRNVMIQHGITANDLKELHYPAARVDLMTCTADAEYDYMLKHYNHPKGVIKKLGLCRYDRLLKEKNTKKQILIMPTWRYFLYAKSDEEFKKSSYYKEFEKLINDKDLNEFLSAHGYSMVFYPHYEMQNYLHLFKSKYENVKIMSMQNADVQQLLIESALLITDYSSVFFDFAYMEKPLAYFWFDEEKFYSLQYERGYFDYRADGFGPVLSTAEQVTDFIKKHIENLVQINDFYKQRIFGFFGKRSADHCEQTYKAIKNILKR